MSVVACRRVVATAAVYHCAETDADLQTWLAACLARHLAGDWGDLDRHDRAVNDAALRCAAGRLLSAYQLPVELTATAADGSVWIITDDLEDPDTATTILWPSDYVRHEAL